MKRCKRWGRRVLSSSMMKTRRKSVTSIDDEELSKWTFACCMTNIPNTSSRRLSLDAKKHYIYICHLSQGTWSPRCFGYVLRFIHAERIKHCCLFADSFGEWCSGPKYEHSRRCLLLIFIYIYIYISVSAEGHKNVRLASHAMISSLNSTRLACASSLYSNCKYPSLH